MMLQPTGNEPEPDARCRKAWDVHGLSLTRFVIITAETVEVNRKMLQRENPTPDGSGHPKDLPALHRRF